MDISGTYIVDISIYIYNADISRFEASSRLQSAAGPWGQSASAANSW